jgi:anion transporter
MGINVTWSTWFFHTAPWSIAMTFVLGFVMIKVIPPEQVDGEASRSLPDLGPMSSAEKRLVAISVTLLGFWVTEGMLHPLDTAASTTVAVALILAPGIGVIEWNQAEKLIPWGTLLLFAVGISLGGVLISTGAAKWVAEATLARTGMAAMSVFAMVALLSAFNIIVHMGFASATGLTAAYLPIIIAFFTSLNRPDVNPLGMVLVQQFVLSIGFLLPVNSPQNMVAYSTGAFTTRDFLRTGVWITAVGYALVLLMTVTYWKWTGLL